MEAASLNCWAASSSASRSRELARWKDARAVVTIAAAAAAEEELSSLASPTCTCMM